MPPKINKKSPQQGRDISRGTTPVPEKRTLNKSYVSLILDNGQEKTGFLINPKNGFQIAA